MDRRRFIVTSISAAAVGTRTYQLNVQYAITNVAGYKLRGRTYNGQPYGPTVVTRPGETLSMKIVNKLPADPPAKPPAGTVLVPVVRNSMEAMDPAYRGGTRPSAYIDPMNNPHGFNTTNLHVHGVQTVPHLFKPIGTSNPAAMMIEIKPGESFQYDFPIPADHPSGLHWYHPHKHGSTNVQVSNGMAGLVVVRGPIDRVPEIAAARELFMVVQ